jgi:hypothetical protein
MAEHVAVRSPVLSVNAPDPAAKMTKGKTMVPDAPKAATSVGITKRKQSKSRNGMLSMDLALL